MKKETNYRSWSFRLLIYVLLLNLLAMYLTIQFIPFIHDEERFLTRMLILSALAMLLFIAGVILTIFSVRNKEKKDYKYKVSVYGYPTFFLISIIVPILL